MVNFLCFQNKEEYHFKTSFKLFLDLSKNNKFYKNSSTKLKPQVPLS